MAFFSALQPFGTINLRLLNVHSKTVTYSLFKHSRSYAKKAAIKGKGKGMMKEAQKGPEVCKDPVRLCTHAVGVNIFKQGEDPPLKAKDEYPEWLFELDLGPPKKLHELEPDSWEYWSVLRKQQIWRHNKLHKGRKM